MAEANEPGELPDDKDPAGPPRADVRRALEAIIMVADEPADPRLLAQLIEAPVDLVDSCCIELAAEYKESLRGFELIRVAGGWRFQSAGDLAPYVERFVLTGQSSRLSAAALETLAIVAYKQPISRAQVGAIRGVSAEGVMRTLQQRGYITELSRDPGPGQAALFGTTSQFLEKLGLNSLDELPPLGDFVPGPEVVEALEHGLRISEHPEPEVAPADLGTIQDPAVVSSNLDHDDSQVWGLQDQAEGQELADAVETTEIAGEQDLSEEVIDLRDAIELDALELLADSPRSEFGNGGASMHLNGGDAEAGDAGGAAEDGGVDASEALRQPRISLRDMLRQRDQ